MSFWKFTGVPERFVVIEVIASASAVIVTQSQLSVLIVGVPLDVIVVILGSILLLVSVFVELIVGTTTHSTANTHALLLERVVSLACHSSMFPVVVIVANVGELVFTTILFHSMLATHADARAIVVSLACPNSIVPTVIASLVPVTNASVPVVPGKVIVSLLAILVGAFNDT